MNKVITKSDCNKLITEAEIIGFKPLPKSGGEHEQIPQTCARTSQFCVKDDVELENKMRV